jgi:hypothetical protein
MTQGGTVMERNILVRDIAVFSTPQNCLLRNYLKRQAQVDKILELFWTPECAYGGTNGRSTVLTELRSLLSDIGSSVSHHPNTKGMQEYAPTVRSVRDRQNDAIVFPCTWNERVSSEKMQCLAKLALCVALELLPPDGQRRE